MKLLIQRLIAILLLVIPGIAAAYGFLLMKDAVYDYFAKIGDIDVVSPDFSWGMFIGGAILFLIGIGFIGGWIFFRDRKHNYLSPRFRPKVPRPPRPQKSPQANDGNSQEHSSSDRP
ncbi:hypothetical protein B1A99_34245 [Cohnella sp. CIP 111063]|jgi:Large-conductance mechanosensitive channel|uniref:DUF2627 family protein n=1 Tax=unclassified Cohnella TaxID=2636738 RepID=UPI000B8BF962|nr:MULTISPECIES: DUF2627 family protein [unclassified Cohnella]OXS52422.1 hypothetical protein B1A99_34245 [Cohnella sp. CIP 111063]PRX58280.1 uncharacterized protein DUF2627 [Cohnella sp. SGD-V74]